MGDGLSGGEVVGFTIKEFDRDGADAAYAAAEVGFTSFL